MHIIVILALFLVIKFNILRKKITKLTNFTLRYSIIYLVIFSLVTLMVYGMSYLANNELMKIFSLIGIMIWPFHLYIVLLIFLVGLIKVENIKTKRVN